MGRGSINQKAMRNLIYIIALTCFSLSFYGCDKQDSEPSGKELSGKNEPNGNIPEGYFEAVFSSSETKDPINGQDARITDLRYLLFKSTGEFVKERHLVSAANGAQTWPLAAIKDTLPKGNYRAVFVGNTEKTLFPYANSTSLTNYSDVLTGYQSGYSSGRIILPNAEFTNNTEYYMANVTFSDTQANTFIMLQRIIGMLNVHRNFVDAQTALNALVRNIDRQVEYEDLIKNQVASILPGLIRNKFDLGSDLLNAAAYGLIGGLNTLVNGLSSALIEPVTEALYAQVLQGLTNQVGMALTGNTDQAGLLAFLGVLLNPWADAQADAAIVSINNFPKSINFDKAIQEYFTGVQKFKFKFTSGSVYAEKDLLIKNFGGLFDIRKINVIKTGILAGIIIDQGVEGPWLLGGSFIDIEDPLTFTNQTNKRFKNNYSFVDLKLKSYAMQSGGTKPLSLSVQLGNVANIDNIVKGLPFLGPILNTTINTLILNPLKTITISTPMNIPLLGVENLTLTGGWDTPTQY